MITSLNYSLSVESRFNSITLQEKSIEIFSSFFPNTSIKITINPEAVTNTPTASAKIENEPENSLITFSIFKNKINIIQEILNEDEDIIPIHFDNFIEIASNIQLKLFDIYVFNKINFTKTEVYTDKSKSPNKYIANSLLKENTHDDDITYCNITLGSIIQTPSKRKISCRDSFFASRFKKSIAVAHSKFFICDSVTSAEKKDLHEIISVIQNNIDKKSKSVEALENAS